MNLYRFSKDFVNLIFREFMAPIIIVTQIQKLLKEIISDWKKFLNESDDYKKQFYLSRHRGWVSKNNNKVQYFYFHRDYRARLEAAGIDYSKYVTMIMNLEKLYQFSIDASLDIAKLLDKRLAGRGIKDMIKKCNAKNTSKHVLALSYYEKNKEQFVLSPRYQRSAWTFCLYQNSPGLYLGTDVDIRYEKQKNKILFICGAKFERLVPGSINMVRSAFFCEKQNDHFFIDFSAEFFSAEKFVTDYITEKERQQGFI